MKKSIFYWKTLPVVAGLIFLLSGCAQQPLSKRFDEVLSRYPQTREPLRIQKLTGTADGVIPKDPGRVDVYIIVHPAYALFFSGPKKGPYAEAKYNLLKRQLDNEARFIAGLAQSGKVLIMIIPGNYASDSVAPLSYISYLNAAASTSRSVFYLFSESSGSGTIAMDDMLNLYQFLRKIKVGKVLVGGGYIGRCQREFYNQFTSYFDRTQAYIVPEFSAISPEDVSEKEAAHIFTGLQRQDYAPLRLFIGRKLGDTVNILSLPQRRE